MNTELPEKKFTSFLKANLKIFYVFISIIILIIIFLFWFINNSNDKKIEISEDFIRAHVFLNNKNNNEAKEILKDIVMEKNTIYASLSLFLLIDENLIQDKKTILSYFDYVFDNNSFSKEDINLLRLKKAIYISDIKKENEIIELLNPLINSDSVWRAQALKFLGDFYYSLNQFKKAKQYYSILLEDDNFSKSEINRKLNSIKNE